jgi:hypothetical protein
VGIYGSKKDQGKEPPKADFSGVRGSSPEPPRPKPKADFSNVKSGGSSTAPPAALEAPPEPAHDTYVVESGDSLSKIASASTARRASGPGSTRPTRIRSRTPT